MAAKSNAMTHRSFVAWLKRQPPDKTYCYLDHGHCLVADYLLAQGYKNVKVYSGGVFNHGKKRGDHDYPQEMDDISNHTPHTYRAALERAQLPRFVW